MLSHRFAEEEAAGEGNLVLSAIFPTEVHADSKVLRVLLLDGDFDFVLEHRVMLIQPDLGMKQIQWAKENSKLKLCASGMGGAKVQVGPGLFLWVWNK